MSLNGCCDVELEDDVEEDYNDGNRYEKVNLSEPRLLHGDVGNDASLM